MTIEEIIRKAITTGDLTPNAGHGILNPEQARRFIQQTFDATNLSPLVRHEMRTARSGEIDKIGIAARIVRPKTENTDDGYRAGVNTGVINYQTTPIRLPWEITEETLRENIEGQSFETIATNLMTSQLGVDLEDLYLNGDAGAASAEAFDATKAYAVGDIVTYNDGLYRFIAAHAAGAWAAADVEEIGDAADKDFLKVNDGWIKQLKSASHVVNAGAQKYSGAMSLDLFYDTLKTLPNKFNNGRLRWLMSPHRAQEWELYLLNKIVNAGGAVPESVYTSPAHIPAVECPSLDDGTIILTDPQNLVVVNTYGVQIRRTTEGKEAIMMDKRFYVVHLDYDPIIEETDAAAIIYGLA